MARFFIGRCCHPVTSSLQCHEYVCVAVNLYLQCSLILILPAVSLHCRLIGRAQGSDWLKAELTWFQKPQGIWIQCPIHNSRFIRVKRSVEVWRLRAIGYDKDIPLTSCTYACISIDMDTKSPEKAQMTQNSARYISIHTLYGWGHCAISIQSTIITWHIWRRFRLDFPFPQNSVSQVSCVISPRDDFLVKAIRSSLADWDVPSSLKARSQAESYNIHQISRLYRDMSDGLVFTGSRSSTDMSS